MSIKRALQLVASLGLSVVLMALLIKVAKIDVRVTLRQLRAVSWVAFTKLVLLNCLLNLLSTEKWRSIDDTLRRSTDSAPSRTASFALTSAGVALGIFLPVQFAVATTRTLGTYVHGGALRRGTAGTLFEQSFDVATACLLAVASGLTWFYKGRGLMWTVSAVIMLCLALLGVGPSVRLIRWLAAKCLIGTETPQGRIGTVLHNLSDFLHSELLNTNLVRRLLALSMVRFAVIVLMSVQTAKAIGVSIPIWSLAAAIPFVMLMSVVALTPGGLGMSEFTFASALSLFGIAFTVGASWTLTNRILVTISYFVVAAGAAAILGVQRIMATKRGIAMQERWRCS
jgi:uncharacterized membrane protein YbhN (UPF0104 family)